MAIPYLDCISVAHIALGALSLPQPAVGCIRAMLHTDNPVCRPMADDVARDLGKLVFAKHPACGCVACAAVAISYQLPSPLW